MGSPSKIPQFHPAVENKSSKGANRTRTERRKDKECCSVDKMEIKRVILLTKILDTDDSAALEVGSIELDGLQFIIAVDDGQIGVGSTDGNTQLDHDEIKV